MILTARFVRQPRRSWRCDWCERPINGSLIYLYGMADCCGDKPSALRYCLRCCQERMEPKDAKFRAALAAAGIGANDA